jgi:hypothetical protein
MLVFKVRGKPGRGGEVGGGEVGGGEGQERVVISHYYYILMVYNYDALIP